MGEVCTPDKGIDLEACCLVAEVYGSAVSADKEDIVGSYFLVHGLDEAVAGRAMEFFAAQPSLIVDVARAVDDSEAPLPARVVIRYTDQARDYLATVFDYGVLRELPDDLFVKSQGWDLFAACYAIEQGMSPPEARPLPAFDYRSLRRKVYANRAGTEEDRNPWLQGELDRLRDLTKDEPEGFEVMAARADDISSVLKGVVVVGDGFSVVIPTIAERKIQKGAIPDWVRSAGREIVVAHGLDAVQAARVLAIVREDPDHFVSKERLLHGNARESLMPPVVIADATLSWITTDFSGRRAVGGYERLSSRLNSVGSSPAVQAGKAGAAR
jgi:hypothetical protein